MLGVVDRSLGLIKGAAATEEAALRIERVRRVERVVGAAHVPRRVAKDTELVPGISVLRLEPRCLLEERLGRAVVAGNFGDGRARDERLEREWVQPLRVPGS